MGTDEGNLLFYGDNLKVLREHVKDESVDLVYLDPPFQSGQTYNVLFEEKNGSAAAAQIKAFEDTWHWTQESQAAFEDLVQKGGRVAEVMVALKQILGSSDMMAYLAMMAPRLVELRRVLKATGSIYLHCDPTASHYLKVLMDGVFGAQFYRNEIAWVRTNAHNFRSRIFERVTDTIFFYGRSGSYTWNPQFAAYSEAQLKRYKVDPMNGRLYKAENLTMTGTSPERQDEWRGAKPPVNRVWGHSLEKREELWAAGMILTTRDGRPRLDGLKVYLDQMPGKAVSTVWDDIPRVGNKSAERLGYQTQKPVALLERILTASSNRGDTVLDPFCGCGTTIEAAQRLGRRWIGIDITHLAINLIKWRLKNAFTGTEEMPKYRVVGEPEDVKSAEQLAGEDPYQFQIWALGLVGARPAEMKKGRDRGIDGKLFFIDEGARGKPKTIILQVKAGKVLPSHVRDLRGTIDREGAEIGALLSFNDPTAEMKREAAEAGFYDSPGWRKKYPRIQLLTVGELLGGKGLQYPAGMAVEPKKAPRARGRETGDLFTSRAAEESEEE